MEECELCDAEFKPGGLSPICNLCWNKMAVQRNDLLAACEAVIAEFEEQNAQEGLTLAFTDSSEYLTVGFRAMVAAVKKAKTK